MLNASDKVLVNPAPCADAAYERPGLEPAEAEAEAGEQDRPKPWEESLIRWIFH